jgi:hypothetical protein
MGHVAWLARDDPLDLSMFVPAAERKATTSMPRVVTRIRDLFHQAPPVRPA